MSDELTIPRPGYRGARRGRGGIDPGTRRLLIIAGCLAGGLALVVGVSNLRHRQGGEVPVVQADTRPIRVKPENPGGLQVANANNEIFSGGNDIEGSKLAPAAETPDPAALKAPPAAPATSAPLVSTPVAAALPPAVPTPPQPAASKSAKLSQALAEPPKPPAPAEKHAAAAPGGKAAVVQLAALTSEEAARSEWQHLQKRMPDLLGGRQPSFSRIEHDGHTFWRVRTTGFADPAQARTFCEHVRAKGGACSIAEF